MDVLYDKIATLCNEKRISITTMCKETDISRSAISDLRMGRSKTLSSATLSKIATYFGVSVDYLLGNKQKEKPITDCDGLTEADRQDIAVELAQLMDKMTQSGDLMFDGDPATPEALQTIRTAFEIGLTNARRINKEKHLKKE